jgi:hypothetical protein
VNDYRRRSSVKGSEIQECGSHRCFLQSFVAADSVASGAGGQVRRLRSKAPTLRAAPIRVVCMEISTVASVKIWNLKKDSAASNQITIVLDTGEFGQRTR